MKNFSIKRKKINFQGFKEIKKSYTEGIYNDSPKNKKLGRDGMSYKNWNDKIKKEKENKNPSLIDIIDKEGKTNKENLNKITDEIFKGTKRIDCLNKEEEQGRIKGGRKNVEASLICKAIEQFYRNDPNFNAEYRRIKEKEFILKYAKDEGYFFDEEKLKEITKEKLASGAESHVYISKDNKYVIKVLNPYFMSENIDESLNDLSLFNYLFEGTSYEILGFGTDEEDNLTIILKQPLIQGKTLSYKVKEEYDMREKTLEYKQQIYNDLTNRIGLIQYSGGNEYANSQYDISDIHLGNVMEVEGYDNLLYIDVHTSLTTPEDFKFGKRNYGNNSIINNE